jgi:hypothetical protein
MCDIAKKINTYMGFLTSDFRRSVPKSLFYLLEHYSNVYLYRKADTKK